MPIVGVLGVGLYLESFTYFIGHVFAYVIELHKDQVQVLGVGCGQCFSDPAIQEFIAIIELMKVEPFVKLTFAVKKVPIIRWDYVALECSDLTFCHEHSAIIIDAAQKRS